MLKQCCVNIVFMLYSVSLTFCLHGIHRDANIPYIYTVRSIFTSIIKVGYITCRHDHNCTYSHKYYTHSK